MNFPIDARSALKDFEEGNARKVAAGIIELANRSYQNGRTGGPFTFWDLKTELEVFRRVAGEVPDEHHAKLIQTTIDLCRDAYDQGRKEATA